MQPAPFPPRFFPHFELCILRAQNEFFEGPNSSISWLNGCRSAARSPHRPY